MVDGLEGALAILLSLFLLFIVWQRGVIGTFEDVKAFQHRMIYGPKPQPKPVSDPKAEQDQHARVHVIAALERELEDPDFTSEYIEHVNNCDHYLAPSGYLLRRGSWFDTHVEPDLAKQDKPRWEENTTETIAAQSASLDNLTANLAKIAALQTACEHEWIDYTILEGRKYNLCALCGKSYFTNPKPRLSDPTRRSRR